MKRPRIDFDKLGSRWGVTGRSVRRWQAAGVDVQDDISVAHHILLLRHAPTPALEAAQKILTQITYATTHS
jgi:hypothetical protein